MFAPSAPRRLSIPAERSNLSQRASNLRVNHAAAPKTIRSETRKMARTTGKGEVTESKRFICNIVFRANQYLCALARARPTEPGCLRIRQPPEGMRMHNTRVLLALYLSICDRQGVVLTQEALQRQPQKEG